MKERVYFADVGNGVIKIGYSSRLGARASAHKRKHGPQTTILFSVLGGQDRERQFHLKFKEYRIQPANYHNMQSAPEHFAIPSDVLDAEKQTLSQENGFTSGIDEAYVRMSFSASATIYDQMNALRRKTWSTHQEVIELALDYYLKALGMPGYGEGK